MPSSKLSGLNGGAPETTFALSDFLVKVKSGGAGDVLVSLQSFLNVIGAGVWTSFSPTWSSTGTAPVINNGTINGAYQQIGKKIDFVIRLTAGSTTTFGTNPYRFTLPVAAHANFLPTGSGAGASVGTWYMENPGVNGYGGIVALNDSTHIHNLFHSITTAGNFGEQTNSAPASLANTWFILMSGSYQAA